MAQTSAGLLMLHHASTGLEFFLVHPGGPYFKNKDHGSWTIPKGLTNDHESLLDAACREFQEETGITPGGPFYDLGLVKQKSGKLVHAWAFLGNWHPRDGISSNTFSLEWPPRSGKYQDFPEADIASWFSIEEARKKILLAQQPFLERAQSIFGNLQ